MQGLAGFVEWENSVNHRVGRVGSDGSIHVFEYIARANRNPLQTHRLRQ
jgi:hypothetical protein